MSDGTNQEPVKKDIKSLKEVIQFGFSVLTAGKDIFSNGFHADKLGELLSVYQAAIPAFNDINDVVAEFEDLDESEVAELSAMLLAQGVADEHTGAIIAKSLKVASSVYSLIKEIKG